MHQIIQVGASNRLHAIEKRCARWLLMTHDRKRSDRFLLTQEYLSEMLGVRRATVNVAVGLIKARGYIKYVRGQITILDRAGLESLSCSCSCLDPPRIRSLEPAIVPLVLREMNTVYRRQPVLHTCPRVDPDATTSFNTSRSFVTSASRLNGFAIYATVGSSTPRGAIISSV